MFANDLSETPVKAEGSINLCAGDICYFLNTFCPPQSYFQMLELKTAICNSITTSDFILSIRITAANNDFTLYCCDNFHLNEDTPSDDGTTNIGIGIEDVNHVTIPDQPIPHAREQIHKLYL